MNIYDIAKHCGVSSATVSRVLNNSPHVSEKTRQKVLAVMEQEGYTPNAFARGLGLDTMGMIGVLCTDISDGYYARAVSLVERSLRKEGLDSLLCCTGDDLSDKKKYMELLLQKRVDGMILIGSAFHEGKDNSHIRAAAAQVPVVMVNSMMKIPGVSCVLCDEYTAVRENVKMMEEQGSKEILYLYDAKTYSGVQKLEGYRQGLADCGLKKELAIQVDEKNVKAAAFAVEQLLTQGETFDGVMASEDLLAVGAQKALAAAGMSMPIIGFNNSLSAECATPSLTSVDNMLETVCPAAVSTLQSALEGQVVPEKLVVSAALVQRETFYIKDLGEDIK